MQRPRRLAAPKQFADNFWDRDATTHISQPRSQFPADDGGPIVIQARGAYDLARCRGRRAHRGGTTERNGMLRQFHGNRVSRLS